MKGMDQAGCHFRITQTKSVVSMVLQYKVLFPKLLYFHWCWSGNFLTESSIYHLIQAWSIKWPFSALFDLISDWSSSCLFLVLFWLCPQCEWKWGMEPRRDSWEERWQPGWYADWTSANLSQPGRDPCQLCLHLCLSLWTSGRHACWHSKFVTCSRHSLLFFPLLSLSALL